MIIAPDRASASLLRGSRRQQAIILLLVSVHLVLGLTRPGFQVAADGAEYLRMAENLRARGEFTYDGIEPIVGKPPGFPALVAAYITIVGSITGFRVLQLLMLAGAYLLTAAISARLFGQKWALLVLAFLVAVDPLRRLADNLLAEPVFLLLTMAGLYALLRSQETRRSVWSVAAGVAFAASAYVRPANFLWPLVIPIVLYLFDRPRWRRGLIVVAVHITVVLPWVARNTSICGSFVPLVANWGPLYYMTNEKLFQIYAFTGSGVIRQSEGYREVTEDEFQFNRGPSERFRRLAVANIRSDTWGYVWRCARQAVFVWSYFPGTKELRQRAPVAFWLGRLVTIGFHLVTALGLMLLWRHPTAVPVLLAAYVIYTAAVHFPVTTESRYLIPAYLCCVPLAAAGVARLTAMRGAIRRPLTH